MAPGAPGAGLRKFELLRVDSGLGMSWHPYAMRLAATSAVVGSKVSSLACLHCANQTVMLQTFMWKKGIERVSVRIWCCSISNLRSVSVYLHWRSIILIDPKHFPHHRGTQSKTISEEGTCVSWSGQLGTPKTCIAF